MENKKKIDILFGLVVIAFLVVTIFLIKDYNVKGSSDVKDDAASMSNLVQRKNDKIKVLSRLLVQKTKECDALQQTLIDTRNNLESLSKKLIDTKVQ